MKEEKKGMNGDALYEDLNGGGANLSYGGNPLFWIGIAVLVCLIFIAVISAMDLKKDSQAPNGGNLIAMGNQAFNGGQRGGQRALAPGGSMGLCPRCRTTGVPQCFYCGSLMGWHAGKNTFTCPGCGRAGNPLCPSCRIPMGAGGSLSQPVGLQTAGFTGTQAAVPPGCATCPTLNQCFPTPAGLQTAGFAGTAGLIMCPGCGYSATAQPGAPVNSAVCPRCNNMMVRSH